MTPGKRRPKVVHTQTTGTRTTLLAGKTNHVTYRQVGGGIGPEREQECDHEVLYSRSLRPSCVWTPRLSERLSYFPLSFHPPPQAAPFSGLLCRSYSSLFFSIAFLPFAVLPYFPFVCFTFRVQYGLCYLP